MSDFIASQNLGFLGLLIIVYLGLLIPTILILVIIIKKIEKLIMAKKDTFKTVFKRIKSEDDTPEAVKNILNKYQSKEELPAWMDQWLNRVEKRINHSGVKVISLVRYFLIIISALIISIAMGAGLLKNPAVTIILIISSFFIPDAILTGYMQKQRLKIIEQLSSATRIFSAEFRETPQVVKALSVTSKRVPSPLKEVLEKAVMDLTVGKDKDKVFEEMAIKMDFDYGMLFVQLLRIAFDDASVQPLFTKLSTKVASLQSLLKKNQSSLAYGRLMGMGVNALIIPVFLLVSHFIPGAYEFMVHHYIGRIIVTMCFLSVLLGLALDRMLNSTKL